MGQCLAFHNTTAFSTDRGEYLKINPNGRIPASSLAIFDRRL
jgi:glutathione S-transferase